MSNASKIEKDVINIMKNFSTNFFRNCIRGNINLTDLIIKFAGPERINYMRYQLRNYRNDGERFNPNNVLEWMKVMKPDVYRLIMESPANKKWFDKQIEDIKRMFLG